MRRRWVIGAAALLLLGAGAATAKTAEPNYETVTWRLMRVYFPVTGPQRGLDVWVMESDLQDAAAHKRRAPELHALVRQGEAGAGTWRIGVDRYFCNQPQVQTVTQEAFQGGRRTKLDASLQPIRDVMPGTPERVLYGVVCQGDRLDGPTVTGVTAALAAQAAADEAFKQKYPPAQ